MIKFITKWFHDSTSWPIDGDEIMTADDPNQCPEERFDVVDLGDGAVGLYHTGYQRYVFMSLDEMEASAIWNKKEELRTIAIPIHGWVPFIRQEHIKNR